MRAPLLITVLAFLGLGPAPAPDGDQRYVIKVDPWLKTLSVTATFKVPAGATLVVDPATASFVKRVEVRAGAAWRAAKTAPKGYDISACAKGGCTVRYDFMLADAATALEDEDQVAGGKGVILATPGSFLLRPDEAADEAVARFRFEASEKTEVACGAFNDDKDDDRAAFAAPSEDVPGLPVCIFGAVERAGFPLRGGTIDAVLMPGGPFAHQAAVLTWIETAGRAIVAYYGRFPVPKVLLVVRPRAGKGAGEGMTLSGGGAIINISVGKDSALADLKDDWVLTHEMVHLAFPSVARRHHWIEEGSATYVEPWARVMVGELTPRRVWGDLVRDLGKGLPEAGDRGLDRTATWGRTYWGGALFCLIADLRIREATKNEKGLRDALAGIVAAGGNTAAPWTMAQALKAGDLAVGVPVLTKLYDEWREAPVKVDLNALWQKLGVISEKDGGVRFDDKAPLAKVRAAISGAPKSP